MLTKNERISPNYLPGSCPYDCHDTRCKAYLNGYCGIAQKDTITTVVNSNNPYDSAGSRHNAGLWSIWPNFNNSISNLDSEALAKVKSYGATLSISPDTTQAHYNRAVSNNYFPFSKIPELDSLGNTMCSKKQLSSYANNYVQQIYNVALQYMNVDTLTIPQYDSFANHMIMIENSIKNDSRLWTYEKQNLLSACAIGRYSGAWWGNYANNHYARSGGSNAKPMLRTFWKNLFKCLIGDVGGLVAGALSTPVGATLMAIGASITTGASLTWSNNTPNP